MAATTITTDIGRQHIAGIGTGEVTAATALELALIQSAAIAGGSDVTEGTTTSFAEIASTGGYTRKDISSAIATTTTSGTVTTTVTTQSWTPSGAAFEDFDMLAIIATVGGTEYVWAVWATASAPRQIGDGSTYNTGALETNWADA